MNTALVWTLWSHCFERAGRPNPAFIANASSIQAAAMSVAVLWAGLLQTTIPSVSIFTLASAIHCSAVSTTVRHITISTSPANRALAGTFHTATTLGAHFWPACWFGAVLSDEALVTLARSGNALAVTAAILWTLEIGTGRTSKVCCANTLALNAHTMVCACTIINTDRL